MTSLLTDDDLTRLLDEAASSFGVPPLQVRERLAEVGDPTPLRRRRGLQLGAAAVLVAVVVAGLLAQSLGGSGANTSSGSSAISVETAPPTVAVPQPVPATGVKAAAPTAVATEDSARVVKSGTITLVVDSGKISATVQQLQATAAAVQGHVSSSQTEELGDHPSATVTVRVPVASYESVIAKVRAFGAKVASVDSSGKDVTATYSDTQAKIASLKAARGRFLSILASARTIGETLTVQQRVDDVQLQIDQLEGQRRLLQSQSDLATLTVSVVEQAPEALHTASPSGLSAAWDRARHGFSSGVDGLVAHSGRALLVLIVAGLALGLGRLGWRLARRHMI